MTNGRDDLSERLEALETRSAYQDDAIETLSRALAEQWREIERLKREVGNLAERLEDAATGPGPIDRPPPHY